MPLYEFKCDKCGAEHERKHTVERYVRKMASKQLREHANCGGTFQRVFSTFTFHMGPA